LKDPTGGRRFWPVIVHSIDVEALKADRDQLFAEVVHLFKAGVPWWPDCDFEAKFIKPEQEARYAADPWRETIANYLQGHYRVTVARVARDALGIETPRLGTHESRRISEVLTSLGWGMKRSHGERWFVRLAGDSWKAKVGGERDMEGVL